MREESTSSFYHLPSTVQPEQGQSYLRVTSELPWNFISSDVSLARDNSNKLGSPLALRNVPPSQDSRGVIFARSWSGNKKKLTVVREPVASFVVLSKFRIRLSKKTAMRSVLHSCGMFFICRDFGPPKQNANT